METSTQRTGRKQEGAENSGQITALWPQAESYAILNVPFGPFFFSASECVSSGRSAAWLARLVRDQEAGGSNPLAPTILFLNFLLESRRDGRVTN